MGVLRWQTSCCEIDKLASDGVEVMSNRNLGNAYAGLDIGGRIALARLNLLWEGLFPAEQARTVHLLVERVAISPTGADIRLRLDGLASLMRDLNPVGVERRRAA